MMGREYFTAAAYIGEGFIVCLECGDRAGMPTSAQLTQAQVDADFSDDGLYCDTCTKEIVEPFQEEEREDNNDR
jgi:transcription elongation factor Elf1